MTDKLRQLILALSNETVTRGLDWEVLDEDALRIHLAGGLLRVEHHAAEYGSGRYEFVLTNPIGQIAEHFFITERDQGFTEVKQMFEAARRRATKSEELIDEMLRHLSPARR